MNAAEIDFNILLPAFVAGLLVAATHVPLGIQVLNRGIVFIDLAIAQIAGLGVIIAYWLGFEPEGWAVQAAALAAALGGAFFLTWTEKRWPEVQEAIIGTVFVVAASAALVLLAAEARHHHGAEHLKDLLVGQILWVNWRTVAWVAAVYAALLVVWFGAGPVRLKRAGFYVIFAVAVTASVQLVGLYLVFATLIVPALATQRLLNRRLPAAYALAAAGYAIGLFVSVVTDWPSGPAIVCVMTALAAVVFGITSGTVPHRA
jgi:zinc/manganese transport system permease protein